MSHTKIAVVGMGTVGSGVVQLLLEYQEPFSEYVGHPLHLEKVVVKNIDKHREFSLPDNLLTDELACVTENPEINVVAQLIGGLEPARTIMLQLLESGKDVVTANKALLAQHGPELFEQARQLDRSIGFEASVAGGIPIVANIGQCLTANRILSLNGILNGTSNFVLTEMETHGTEYQSAVARAQTLGYAEADPTMDVDGTDAAQKLAILAHLAFGARVHWTQISTTGIDQLDVIDIDFAKELGYRVKLLAVARHMDEGLDLFVCPTLVKIGTPLAEVRGAYNAVSLVGNAVGPVSFHGLGAGQMPTASAVVADLIDTVVGRTAITFRALKLWSTGKPQILVADDIGSTSRFYLRFGVEDHPGVIAEITGVLGRNNISIASLIQHEGDGQNDHFVPLVIMTHVTSAGAVRKACKEIDLLPSVRSQSLQMRVANSI